MFGLQGVSRKIKFVRRLKDRLGSLKQFSVFNHKPYFRSKSNRKITLTHEFQILIFMTSGDIKNLINGNLNRPQF